MTIDVVFDPPLPSDSREDFNQKAFDTVAKLNPWSAEANQTAADINDMVTSPGVIAIGSDLTGANTIGTVAAVAADVSAVAAIDADVSEVAAIAADVPTVAGISGSVPVVATIEADVSAVAGVASDIPAVAASASNIDAVAADLSNVDAVAGSIAAVNATGNDIAAVNTVAENIANINAAVADLPALSAKVSKAGDTMTGPLSVPAGASGAQVPQAQEIPALVRAMAVGTVSQSGGVPTGAVIETGSNANGRYARFADGSQICWQTVSGLTTTVASDPLGYRTSDQLWTYPAAFAFTPTVHVTGGYQSSGNCHGATAATVTGASANFIVYGATSSTVVRANLVAFGRWF